MLVDISGMDAAARIVGEGDDGETVSARELAKRCLRVVGQEIGANVDVKDAQVHEANAENDGEAS